MTDSEKTKQAPVLEATEPGAPETVEAPPEPLTPERVNQWNAYYDRYVVLSVLLLVFIVSSNKITHSSIWPQLKVGMEIASKAFPPTTDVYSYTEQGKPWVDIHWLFDLGCALVFKAAGSFAPMDPGDALLSSAKAEQFGAAALIALTAFARMLTALLLIKVRRAGPGVWWTSLCVFLALGAVISPTAVLNARSTGGIPGMVLLGGLASPGLVTPGTWGMLLLVIELLLIHKATNLGHRVAAYALPFLFALWVNVDESFLVGLFILLATAIGRLRPASIAARGDEEARPISAPAAFGVFLASALACLVNPAIYRVYPAAFSPFVSLYRGFFRPAGATQTIDQLSFFSVDLREGEGWKIQIAFFVILVSLGFASFVLNRSRFSLSRFLVYVLASVLWGTLVRYGAEFAIILATTVALNGQEWYQENFGNEGRLGAGWWLWSVGGRAVTILVVALCIVKSLTGIGGNFNDTEFGFGFDPDDFAFEAASFLKTAPIKGNVLNTTAAQGDAIIWRAVPDRKTFTDSRRNLFPFELLDKIHETRVALTTDDVDKWKPFLDEYQVSAVMIPMSSSQGAPSVLTYDALMRSPNWVPFYDDGNVVMFGRADSGAPAADIAYFRSRRLDPDSLAYTQMKPIPAPDRLPTPITWYDDWFLTRTWARPQPHTDASRRWLSGAMLDPSATTSFADPARCILAIREARTALAAKPDDSQAFRLLARAYRDLMIQETALLGGITLKPENMKKVAEIAPRSDLLMTRFRQRAAALNFAIQTTPPTQSESARQELMALNLELFQLYISANYLDLARDRLATVVKLVRQGDFTDETRKAFEVDLAKLDETVKKIQSDKEDQAIERQLGPVPLASFAISRGAPGLAIHELEEAERTGTNPNLVKPLLLDLYCDTGQPEKGVELIGSSNGAVGDPAFGEPGLSEMRQGRTYFLWGNYEYTATLWERNALLRLRQERAMRALEEGKAFLSGGVNASTAAVLEMPEKIANQAAWEFDAGICRLEGGYPKLATEHFTKALTLVPTLSVRPVIAYYLEKLGAPVPPLPSDEKAKEPAAKPADEKPKDAKEPKP